MSPTFGGDPVTIARATSKSTTGFGFVTFMYVTVSASTRMRAIRGSFAEPSRAPPSSPSHAFQSGFYSASTSLRSVVIVASPETDTHSRERSL